MPRGVPKLPTWAKSMRVVRDQEHPFLFMRNTHKEPWEAYVRSGDDWIEVQAVSAYMHKLDKAREVVITILTNSIGAMAMALHPGARQSHLRRDYANHLCDAPYNFKTVYRIEEVTCPLCLAIVAEDMQWHAGSAEVEAAREHVRQVREFNALGRLVDGEDVTTKL